MRHIPESEQAFIVERLVPVVEEMADSIEGRRDLAAVCAAYLKDHRPETTVHEAEVDSPPREESRRPRPGGDRKGRRQGSRRRR